MRINKKRLKTSMLEIGNIGKDSTGGITRLAFSMNIRLQPGD